MKRKKETVIQQTATRTKYSDAAIQWAESMLLRGVAPAEVARKTGINGNYARTMKARLKTRSAQPAREYDSDILREFVALRGETVDETLVTMVEESVSKPRFTMSTLDIVFYTTTATACAGFVTAFQWLGLPVSLVYSLILIDAMGMAKDATLEKTVEQGSAAVVVFEIIAAFAHTYVFNIVMWANAKSLPWDMSQKIVGGEVVWPNADKPFIIAVGIAVILSGSAIYAVDTTIKKTRERVKNATK